MMLLLGCGGEKQHRHCTFRVTVKVLGVKKQIVEKYHYYVF